MLYGKSQLIYLALALVTFVAFVQVGHNDFINYDDAEYVTENEKVQKGLNIESFVWAFTTGHASNWHPLTWLSHMLDCQLYGLSPAGHHLTNLFLHLLNTLLLFGVLKTMTRAVWPSAFAAVLFAVHPLHVESVAWIAERKDVLSAFFWMLTMAAYLRYTKHPCIVRYLPVVFAFALGLMTKPMLVTLPFVLLLLDYWPLKRLQFGRINIPESQSHKRLILEKIPLFTLAAISSVITCIVQQSGGAMGGNEVLTVGVRLANALVSYVGYIHKMIYPKGLAVLYPHPLDGVGLWQPVVSFIILAVISAGVIFASRKRRYLATGWFWYLGTLIPVIGLVQVGSQAMADRYTYLPSIGIFIILAWGIPELLARWRCRKVIPAVLAGIVLVACSGLSRKNDTLPRL